jgi:hypothetical protein
MWRCFHSLAFSSRSLLLYVKEWTSASRATHSYEAYQNGTKIFKANGGKRVHRKSKIKRDSYIKAKGQKLFSRQLIHSHGFQTARKPRAELFSPSDINRIDLILFQAKTDRDNWVPEPCPSSIIPNKTHFPKLGLFSPSSGEENVISATGTYWDFLFRPSGPYFSAWWQKHIQFPKRRVVFRIHGAGQIPQRL